MTPQEALLCIKNGGVVSSGGYTYGDGFYFAYGTYPECIRSGDADPTTHRDDSVWEELSDKDIVERCGFSEQVWNRPVREDGTVDFNSLRRYLEDNLTVSEYKDPYVNSAYCRKFFKEIGND